jgi:hypothetical protein
MPTYRQRVPLTPFRHRSARFSGQFEVYANATHAYPYSSALNASDKPL